MPSVNGFEWVILIVLALALLGPSRLPEYAASLARLVRRARDFAMGAREQVRAELGPEFDEVDWQKYDPRRYHPRQIVRNALSEAWEGDDAAATKPVSATMATGTARRNSGTAAKATPGTSTAAKSPAAARSTAAKTPAATKPTASKSTAARAAVRPARTPRPAAVAATHRPSPPPSTWAEAATRADVVVDAT